MKIKRVLLSAVLGLFGLGLVTTAHADSNFSVQAVVPASQIDKSNTSYFDLKLNPGQSETLTFNLRNTANKAIAVDVAKGTATTTDGGAVDYAGNGPFDKSLPDQIGKYIDVPKTVSIAANETKPVTVKFTMPQIPVTGILAGGVEFTQEGQKTQEKAGNGMSVNSVTHYTIAVLARNTTDNNDVADTLNPGTITASQVNKVNAVKINMSNPKQALLNRLEVVANVKDPDGRTAFKGTTKMMQMAPNSTFNYTLRGDAVAYQAGKYNAKVTAFWGQNDAGQYADATGTRFNYRKDWSESFTISANQAKKFNDNDALIQSKHSLPMVLWIIIIVVILLILIIVGLLWFILAKRRKDEREENMAKLQ